MNNFRPYILIILLIFIIICIIGFINTGGNIKYESGLYLSIGLLMLLVSTFLVDNINRKY